MSNLYQLSSEYISIFNDVCNSADENGEVDVELVEQLNKIQQSFEEKAVNTAYVYCMLDGEIEQTDKLLKRLTGRINGLKNARERIKKYLSSAMQKAGYESIKGDYANISFRASEETVIDDLSMLDDEFFVIKKEVSKTAIKQAIKQGREVRGAHIEKKSNLQIK